MSDHEDPDQEKLQQSLDIVDSTSKSTGLPKPYPSLGGGTGPSLLEKKAFSDLGAIGLHKFRPEAQRQVIKELMSGGVEGLLAQQRGIKELMSGGVEGLFAQQRGIKDLLGGGAEGLFAQQRGIKELLSGGTEGLLAQQRGIKELLGGGAEGLLAQQRGIKELLGGGAEVLLAQQQSLKALLDVDGLKAYKASVETLLDRPGSLRNLAFAAIEVLAPSGGLKTTSAAALTIANSKAFKALADVDRATLLAAAAGFSYRGETSEHVSSSLSVADFFDAEVINPAENVEAELTSTLTAGGDVSSLSVRAKLLLWLLGMVMIGLLQYLAMQNGVREELCFWQPKLMPGLTTGQTGKVIRQAMCNFPLEVLTDFRFIDSNGVNLRAAPSTKSEVLGERLTKGQIVQVIDSTNRSWLLVKLVDQEIEGWVFRRYTHKFSK
ncbi:SH3 domain-containing protein [Pseudomonas sp. KHPS1]|nr:SH3 domain-containing protein [Pseudomonas sp. KHPS1]ATH81274.1 hypothetical protein CO724_08940 [Pseudomonas mendocina]UTH35216.1 SH3 domain-containing protein [Pseudomonas sp. KHPS1]